MPLPSRLIERFSFGGRTIAPLLSASLTAIRTFTMAWSPHGPSDPGLSSSARGLDRADTWPLQVAPSSRGDGRNTVGVEPGLKDPEPYFIPRVATPCGDCRSGEGTNDAAL